jgi:hypothetical protein
LGVGAAAADGVMERIRKRIVLYTFLRSADVYNINGDLGSVSIFDKVENFSRRFSRHPECTFAFPIAQ